MSYIDAMIAQGGTPFDVAKYTSAGHAGQLAKQNDLLNLGRQKELDEYDANTQVREDERKLKSRTAAAKLAMPYIQNQDIPGLTQYFKTRAAHLFNAGFDVADEEGALKILESGDQEKIAQVIKGLTIQAGDDAPEYFAPTEATDAQGNPILIQASKGGGVKPLTGYSPAQDKAKIPRPVPPELAARFNIPPEEIGNYQLSSTGQIELVPGRGGDAKPRYETINNVPRWIEGPDKGKEVFPGVEISPETERNLTNEAGVRKEFNSLLSDYNKVSDSFARIKASVSDPSPAGDMALIFNYMKMLDPGSTVREGEYAKAEDTTNVPGRIVTMYNKAVRGEGLNADQRADFSSRANKLFNAARGQAQKTADAYTIIAKDANMPVESIIANFLAQGNQEDIPLPEGYTETP